MSGPSLARRMASALARRWRTPGRLLAGAMARRRPGPAGSFRWRSSEPSRWIVDVAERAVARSVKCAPRYPEPGRPIGETLRLGDLLLEPVFPVGEGQSVALERLSWARDPFGGRGSSARLQFHALHQVEILVQAHAASGRPAYLDRAKAIAGRWMADGLGTRSREVWDDHATALRAITLCRLWDACRPFEPGETALAARLVRAVLRHATALADDREYRADHNHGVVQAYALLSLGLVFPDLPDAERWATTGRARLEAQMAANVSPEGLHREHSPTYHFFVLRHFLDAAALVAAHGLEFSPGFAERLDRMMAAGLHLIKPDGTPAALGDTGHSIPIEPDDLTERSAELADALRYCLTAGARGRPPGLTSTLAHGAGYAFLRGGPAAGRPPADELYAVVRTATFRTAHVHRDVLSFELYASGADLVVDSGGPYAYGSPVRGELMRTAAHSTLTVDDENQDIGAAEILRWGTDPLLDVLDARHELHPGVVARRLVALVRPGYLVVVDRLDGTGPHRYGQAFHLAPALEVALAGPAVTTTRSGPGPTVELRPLMPEGLGTRVERGCPGAHRGWVCAGPRQLVPAPVVRFECEGRSAAFVTLVLPRPPGRAFTATAAARGRPFQEDLRITVETGGTRDHLTVPPAGAVTLRRETA